MTSRTVDYFQEPGGPEPIRAEPGDLHVTARVVHRVLAVRPVESRKWHDRWRLELERLGSTTDAQWATWEAESAARFGSCRRHYVDRYEHGETPRDFAIANGYLLDDGEAP